MACCRFCDAANDSIERYWIKVGRHFRYPTCCIFFFVTTWAKIYRSKIRDPYVKAFKAKYPNIIAGYIPCPQCVQVGLKGHLLK